MRWKAAASQLLQSFFAEIFILMFLMAALLLRNVAGIEDGNSLASAGFKVKLQEIVEICDVNFKEVT